MLRGSPVDPPAAFPASGVGQIAAVGAVAGREGQ